VSKVTKDGQVSTFAIGFEGAAGLAFNSAGILHVSDDSNQVYRVSESGDLSLFVDWTMGLGNPNAIAFDADDNLYVVSCAGNVSQFDPEGNLMAFELAGGFDCPQAIVVDDPAGVLYVSDGDGTVFQIDKVTGGTSVYAETYAYTEGGLVQDEQGDLYLSAYGDGLVLRVDATDQTVSTCLSGITTARGLLFDGRGRLYVTAYHPGEIYRASGCQP
jgi:serine/threonine-protein kinase